MSNRNRHARSACEREIRNYLENGKTPDFCFSNWPGSDLISTRKREWLLPIESRMRETFAYACEAFSRISDNARERAERRRRLDEYREHHVPGMADNPAELLDILAEAVEARKGWQRILKRCSHLKHP